MLDTRRRCILAAISLTIAWPLFHNYVADLLWTRGDEFLRNGSPAVAERYYRRALTVDSDCRNALDRLLFAVIEVRAQPDLDAAIATGDRYLQRHPNAVDIRTDRALALFVAHRNGEAAREFEWLARRLHDGRYIKLALHARLLTAGRNRT